MIEVVLLFNLKRIDLQSSKSELLTLDQLSSGSSSRPGCHSRV